jgi:Zn-finger protein
MNNERKNRECLECGCNVFTITKIRDLDSVLKRTGHQTMTCIDCGSYQSEWRHTESSAKTTRSKTIERLEKRNTRLQRDNDRMRQFIDEYYQNKLDQ